MSPLVILSPSPVTLHRCYDAHLNGLFPVVPDRRNASFLTWWTHENQKRVPLVLDKVTMRIKPGRV